MTSYRLFLLRAALGRIGRAIAYYWVSLRAQIRMWRSSYHVALAGQGIRTAASATGRVLRRLPRHLAAGLAMVAWFIGQLPAYIGRVIADRREDRAELRAERRLMAAQRQAHTLERRAQSAERKAQGADRRDRRKAELAEIKASRGQRPHQLPVPAWISRMERPQRPAGVRRIPVPRRAMVAAVLTMAAAVPAYAVVSGALNTDEPALAADPNVIAVPGAPVVPGGSAATPIPGQPVPGGTTTTPSTPAPVAGSTGAFVAALPVIPTAVPLVPGPRVTAAAPGGTTQVSGHPVVGSITAPFSLHQQREARRQAKYQAQTAKAEAQLSKDPGK